MSDQDWYAVDLVVTNVLGNAVSNQMLMKKYKIDTLSLRDALVKFKIAKYEFVQETSTSS